jgi:hypothetical protein
MRVAQELLSAPTTGRQSARPGGGGEGSQRSQISLPSHPECMKKVPKRPVYQLNDFKNANMPFFA